MTADVVLPGPGLDLAYPEALGSALSTVSHKPGPARFGPTAEILRRLPPGTWRVLHDVVWPGREGQVVDHVVIGPGGIFVIDVRHWEGPVVLDDGILRVEERPREREVAEVADAALAVAAVLERIEPRWVVPVLCLQREEPVAGMTRGVVYCSSSLLEEMITSRREAISLDRARFIAQLLEIKLVGDQGLAATATAEVPEGPSPRRRRRRRLLADGLAPILLRSGAIGVGIAVLVGDPGLLERAARALSSLLRVT